jgi:hypothetical protein
VDWKIFEETLFILTIGTMFLKIFSTMSSLAEDTAKKNLTNDNAGVEGVKNLRKYVWYSVWI